MKLKYILTVSAGAPIPTTERAQLEVVCSALLEQVLSTLQRAFSNVTFEVQKVDTEVQ